MIKVDFLCYHKLDDISNSKPYDYSCLWISPISHLFKLIEEFKIKGYSESEISKFSFGLKDAVDEGVIYSVGLTRDKIETFLRNHEEYFAMYCNQKKDPLIMADEISLIKIDDCDFWDEDVLNNMYNC